jgi:hypothetical protein
MTAGTGGGSGVRRDALFAVAFHLALNGNGAVRMGKLVQEDALENACPSASSGK